MQALFWECAIQLLKVALRQLQPVGFMAHRKAFGRQAVTALSYGADSLQSSIPVIARGECPTDKTSAQQIKLAWNVRPDFQSLLIGRLAPSAAS